MCTKSKRLSFVGWGAIGLTLVAAASMTHGDVVGQWHFDEDPGSAIAADQLGVNDGALAGSADFVAGGVSGNALATTIAGGGYVNMGDCFPFNSGDFSLVLWVRTAPGDQAPDYLVLSRHRATIVAGYIIGINANGAYGQTDKAWFYQSVPPGGELISNTSVNDGDWHQVAVSYKAGSTVSLFIDGAPADNSRPSVPIDYIAAPLLIGALDWAGVPRASFNGEVDELQIYNHAISPPEAQYLFEHPTATVCPGDLTGDGERDQADLGELLASYNVDDGGDIDGDGDTDQADLGILLANYGESCP
jgi:Concanavalin A-like lectin/glucanases superfamily